MQALTTAKSAYRCDTDLLTREVHRAAEELFARTARHACRVLVHPLDGQALIMAPIGPYGPVVHIGADGRPRFLNMVMFYEPEQQPGMARVEVCDGCLSYWRDCEHGTCRGGDVRGAARLVVDALADLGDEWARAGLREGSGPPRVAGAAPDQPSGPEPPAVLLVKRTRRASRRELERRAATAARKAAEAAAKAEKARRAAEELSDGGGPL